MRLALAIYGDISVRSGGNLYDRKLIDYLGNNSTAVDVFSFPSTGYGRSLSQNAPGGIRELWETQLRQCQYDAILQDELIHPSVLGWNRELRTLAGAPLISIVHHLRSSEGWPEFEGSFYRRLEHLYLESVDGFIFNSETTKRSVESLTPLADRPNVVATPGGNRLIDLLSPAPSSVAEWSAIIRRRLEHPCREILFVGNLIPRKGLLQLVDALGRLKDVSDFSLQIVGRDDADIDYVTTLHRRIRELGVQDRISFHGDLPDRDLATLMNQCHLFAMPSWYEGFGIAYLEAMSFALPVVASSHGAAGDLITSATGKLVTPRRVDKLAQTLKQLLDNPGLLFDMSLAARAEFERFPTWEQSGDRIFEFLDRLRHSRYRPNA